MVMDMEFLYHVGYILTSVLGLFAHELFYSILVSLWLGWDRGGFQTLVSREPPALRYRRRDRPDRTTQTLMCNGLQAGFLSALCLLTTPCPRSPKPGVVGAKVQNTSLVSILLGRFSNLPRSQDRVLLEVSLFAPLQPGHCQPHRWSSWALPGGPSSWRYYPCSSLTSSTERRRCLMSSRV